MLKISFDFNETTHTVTNIQVTESETTRRVRTNTTPIVESENKPDVEVLDNKLQLSKAAIQKLGAEADDRISVQYINEGIGKAIPVIGKAEVFTDRLDGNRLTRKGTVSFRGEKRSTLVDFGTMFTLEDYKDGIWKLVPFEDSEKIDLSEENSDADALNDAEIENEIEELMSSNDDLPF